MFIRYIHEIRKRLYSFNNEDDARKFSAKFNGSNPVLYMEGVYRVTI